MCELEIKNNRSARLFEYILMFVSMDEHVYLLCHVIWQTLDDQRCISLKFSLNRNTFVWQHPYVNGLQSVHFTFYRSLYSLWKHPTRRELWYWRIRQQSTFTGERSGAHVTWLTCVGAGSAEVRQVVQGSEEGLVRYARAFDPRQKVSRIPRVHGEVDEVTWRTHVHWTLGNRDVVWRWSCSLPSDLATSTKIK